VGKSNIGKTGGANLVELRIDEVTKKQERHLRVERRVKLKKVQERNPSCLRKKKRKTNTGHKVKVNS